MQCGFNPYADFIYVHGMLIHVATAAKLKEFEDYLQENGISPNILKKRCSDDHIHKISKNINDWEVLSLSFGLDESTITAIKRDYDKEQRRRHVMLKEWKKMKCPRDTYKELIKVFVEEKENELAMAVCEILIEGGNKIAIKVASVSITGIEK